MNWDELNDWIYENAREVYEATKYLHLSAQLKCWRKVYNLQTNKSK